MLRPMIGELEILIGKAKEMQNAGNYVRLVTFVGETITGVEQSLHLVNQRKPFVTLIRRSILQHDSELKANGGDDDKAKLSSSSAGAKSSQQHYSKTEFEQVIDVMSNGILVSLLKLLEISSSLKRVPCGHLKSYLQSNLTGLCSRTISDFKDMYSASLEALNWPISMAESDIGSYSETSLHYFRSSLILLVKLQHSLSTAKIMMEEGQEKKPETDDEDTKDQSSSLESLSTNSLWCMELLVKPLELRFNFNFRGKESTNRIDRPEWHFTYVRQLLKTHAKFLEFVTSLLSALGMDGIDTKHEILRRLNVLIKDKLFADLTLITSSINSSGESSLSSVGQQSIGGQSSSPIPTLVQNSGQKLSSFVLGSTSSLLSPLGSTLNTGSSLNMNALSSSGNISSTSLSHGSSNKSSLTSDVASALFAHTINEILDFEKSLNDIWDYPRVMREEYPRPIDVLEHFHSQWLDLEVNTMEMHLKQALESSNAWERQYGTVSFSEDLTRVPRYPYLFFSVMSILHDRYQLLGSGHEEAMSDFLLAQLGCLTNFLSILRSEAQSSTSLTHRCIIYNASWYARRVLEEWSNLELYIELYMWNKKVKSVEQLSGSVFDPNILEFKSLCKHNLQKLVDATMNVFTTAYYKSYSKTNFLEEKLDLQALMSRQKDNHQPYEHLIDVSPQFCDLLFLTREVWTEIEKTLVTYSFRKYWKSFANVLNIFLFENLILKKYFNFIGSLQLKTDLNALWLLWKNHTPNPQLFFPEINDAIIILTLPADQINELSSFLASLGGRSNQNPHPLLSSRFGLSKLTSPSLVRQVVDRRLIDKRSSSSSSSSSS